MSYIASFPTGCAPTKGTSEKPGWSQCSNNCSGCVTCVPNKNTTCGQMVLDSGIGCVPENCISECCVNSQHSVRSNDKHVKFYLIFEVVLILLLVYLFMRYYK